MTCRAVAGFPLCISTVSCSSRHQFWAILTAWDGLCRVCELLSKFTNASALCPFWLRGLYTFCFLCHHDSASGSPTVIFPVRWPLLPNATRHSSHITVLFFIKVLTVLAVATSIDYFLLIIGFPFHKTNYTRVSSLYFLFLAISPALNWGWHALACS
jgi:hypothetical protein